jgi:EAL domain-containing protein (putative c-di-GMP-specific phosphodiesterase class I)/GGDEF domain-containing protein
LRHAGSVEASVFVPKGGSQKRFFGWTGEAEASDRGKQAAVLACDIVYGEVNAGFLEVKGYSGFAGRAEGIVASAAKALGLFLFHYGRQHCFSCVPEQAEGRDGFSFSYAIDDSSFRLGYVSGAAVRIFEGIKVGDLCYEAVYGRSTPCDYCPATSGSPTEKYNGTLGRWMHLDVVKADIEGRRISLINNRDGDEGGNAAPEKDPVTGLFTYSTSSGGRQYLENGGEGWTLLYINIEKFSMVNEQKGMKETGGMIRQFSKLLFAWLKKGDIVCRYFSDVFLVLTHSENNEDITEGVRHFYEIVNRWNVIKYPGLRLSLKTGIYPVYPDETDIDKIVEGAEIARVSIPRGKGYAIFDDGLRNEDISRRKIEDMMADAIDNEEFQVFLQPKVELKTRKIVGAEALVRWMSSSGRMMPAEFLPFFESNGFIREMDFYMSEKVLKMIREWIGQGKKVVPVSVNIAGTNINDPVFVEKIKELIKKYHIPPYTIELELREDMFMGNDDAVQRSIRSLRRMGISFALDDFGKGFSSINVIRKLPIDVIKLDKDFFDHTNISERERVMLTHMVRMAKSLDMKVLFEGVETEEQEDVLKTTGCDLGQGYLYGRPMPVDAFQNMLARQE